MKKKWVIPYIDQPFEFWDTIESRHRDSIKEIYFPLDDNLFGSGRPPQPKVYESELLRNWKGGISLLVNPIVLRNPVEAVAVSVIKKIEQLSTLSRISSVCVVNIKLGQEIKKNFPDIDIVASVLLDIFSPSQLDSFEDTFSVIVPSSRIMRDIRALKSLKSGFNGKLRLIVNEGCLSNCHLRVQHFFEMSEPSIRIPKSLCDRLLEDKPWLGLTGAWVLPQHLHLFDEVSDEYKLAGRVSLRNPSHYNHVLACYIDRRDLQPYETGGGPASVKTPIRINENFYLKTLYCNKICSKCSVCRDYWENNH